MDFYEPWELIPFGRTYVPIYALLAFNTTNSSPILPALLLLRNERLVRDRNERIGLY